MRGIDVSHWQDGLEIGRIREDGYDFAILKITDGAGYADPSAPVFYTQAKAAGIPVGGYCYSHAVTAEEAREEAAHILKTLMGFPMPLGLYLDVEEPDQLSLSHDELLDVISAWCAQIRAAGYIPGVYGSESNLWAKILPEELAKDVMIWVAHYGKEPEMPCDLWQSSDAGNVTGYNGPVDTDEARSGYFERQVVRGYGGVPDTNVGDKTLALLAEYLQTAEFAQNFKNYIERRKHDERT